MAAPRAHRSPPLLQRRDIDAQPLKEPAAVFGEDRLLLRLPPAQETLLKKTVEDEHAQLSGEMVVTHPSFA